MRVSPYLLYLLESKPDYQAPLRSLLDIYDLPKRKPPQAQWHRIGHHRPSVEPAAPARGWQFRAP